MERRKFIKSTFIAGISALSLSKTNSAIASIIKDLESNDPFFKLSLAQWSIHRMIKNDGFDPFLFANIAGDMGFAGLEYVNALYFDYLKGFSSQTDAMKSFIKKSLDQSKRNKLENVLIMIDGEGNLAESQKEKRISAVNNHHKWIEAASALSCKSVRVNLRGSNKPEEWKENSMASLISLSEYAKKYNLNVIVENHGNLSSNAKLLTEVIRGTAMDNCGTLPDFGNFCYTRDNNLPKGEDCIDGYDKYLGVSEMLPFAKGVSAKTYDFDNEGNETTIDYKRMLQMVEKSGYKGFIGVEYEGDRLSEKEGILATKKLLLKLGSEV
jgi:sugar phosphate isomerase/epimerase